MRGRRFALLAFSTAAVAAAAPGAASAFMVLTVKGFAPEAHLRAEGHQVEVTGIVDCFPAGERYVVNANVIQGDVVASRTLHGVCSEGPEEWTVLLHTTGGQRLVPGQAQACGDAQSMKGNVVTGSIQWCKPGGLSIG
jgi:hypothetical protein